MKRDRKKLNTLFKFQLILVDIQSKVAQAIVNGVDQKRVSAMNKMHDDLKEVYDEYDKFYFDEQVTRMKYVEKDLELMKAYAEINNLSDERDKLLKTLEWSQATS
jgi:predicted outer membrane protein